MSYVRLEMEARAVPVARPARMARVGSMLSNAIHVFLRSSRYACVSGRSRVSCKTCETAVVVSLTGYLVHQGGTHRSCGVGNLGHERTDTPALSLPGLQQCEPKIVNELTRVRAMYMAGEQTPHLVRVQFQHEEKYGHQGGRV